MCQGRVVVLVSVLGFLLAGMYLLVVSGGRVPFALASPPAKVRMTARSAVRVSPSPVLASGSLGMVGPPSISVALIERVFAAYRSPAAGSGQALYDLGVQYGIDPVYALAFFWHESTLGRAGWGRSIIRWVIFAAHRAMPVRGAFAPMQPGPKGMRTGIGSSG